MTAGPPRLPDGWHSRKFRATADMTGLIRTPAKPPSSTSCTIACPLIELLFAQSPRAEKVRMPGHIEQASHPNADPSNPNKRLQKNATGCRRTTVRCATAKHTVTTSSERARLSTSDNGCYHPLFPYDEGMSAVREKPKTSGPAHWGELVQQAIRLRHHFHRHPELGWHEVMTAQTIRAQLEASDIAWQACAQTGTVATLAADAEGDTIALRADIDALPILESANHDYSSQHSGCMHACGHDGHAATLFATLWWLKAHEAHLPGPVRILFQPAEEGGHGARKMIEEGAIDGVSRIYGWHNWPAIPKGKAVCPDGPVMAANGTFNIRIVGRGGHASQPELCHDPVLAAAATVLALQQIFSRRWPPQKAGVLSITRLLADSNETVIPDEVELAGSFRITDDELRPVLHALINEIVENTAASFGTQAQVNIFPRYGVTSNHPGAAARMRTALTEELGTGWLSDATAVPVMASEDFSYYLQKIPGAYALAGAGDGSRHDISLHNADYDFNDQLIDSMGRVLARLAGAPVV